MRVLQKACSAASIAYDTGTSVPILPRKSDGEYAKTSRRTLPDLSASCLCFFFHSYGSTNPATQKEIRGYKVERAAVEMKKDKDKNGPFNPDPDTLIRFGEARLAGVTPLRSQARDPGCCRSRDSKRSRRFPDV